MPCSKLKSQTNGGKKEHKASWKVPFTQNDDSLRKAGFPEFPTTDGSRLHQPVPQTSSQFINTLRSEGAVFLGSTMCPEGGYKLDSTSYAVPTSSAENKIKTGT
jgi:Asp-tRNA(Asn)/Glu-tRNA(Gln) amidotransferase A subunit family amidase